MDIGRPIQVISLCVFAALVLAFSAYVVVREPAATSGTPATPLVTASPRPTVAPLAGLSEGTQVLFFGDSYTAGVGADKPTNGYAYLTARAEKWKADIRGVGGTGYLNGTVGPTFPERAKTVAVTSAPDLIVLQGSSNDMDQDLAALPDAVDETLRAFDKRWPGVKVVMLGPAPPAVAAVNDELRRAAVAAEVPYIDAYGEDWIWSDWISLSEATQTHPNARGHALLADRLVEALEQLRTSA